jgi:hypothetical protein
MNNTPTPSTALDDEVWTIEDVCTFLKISNTSYYRRLHHILPHFCIPGGHRRFLKSRVLAWAESQYLTGDGQQAMTAKWRNNFNHPVLAGHNKERTDARETDRSEAGQQ